MDIVRSRAWPSWYSEDGEQVAMPASVEEIFDRGSRVGVLWVVTPQRGVRINSHFFTPTEIEFDLAPGEIVGQVELDVVVDFVRLIGSATGKVVTVCFENWADEPLMVYDPTAGCVTARSGVE